MGILRIEHGDYSALVSHRGATLVALFYRNWNILSGPELVLPELGHHGAVLAPWPNRLAQGKYSFQGSTFQLPQNDSKYGHAIHGFAFMRDWQVKETGSNISTMRVPLYCKEGYPYQVDLEVTYKLTGAGLKCISRWVNKGEATAPFGLGFHPYFRPGPNAMEHWQLQIDASKVMEVDPKLLPLVEPSLVSTTPFDFRTPRAIGNQAFSNTYLASDSADKIQATLTDPGPGGHRIVVQAHGPFRYLQAFTGDLPLETLHRKGLSLEPQTCPTNAFVTKESLLELPPESTGSATWSVSATPSDPSA